MCYYLNVHFQGQRVNVKIKELGTFETSGTTRSTKERHIREDWNLQLLSPYTLTPESPKAPTVCEEARHKEEDR